MSAPISSELLTSIPTTPGISITDTLAEAGIKIWRYHFSEMICHEPDTRRGKDIEALHNMRVATRRLRASFKIFGNAFEPKILAPHLKGLRTTGQALGKVRDMDVFIEKVNVYKESLSARQQAQLQPLLTTWEAECAKARKKMIDYLDSEAYQQFQTSFSEFLQFAHEHNIPSGELKQHIHIIIPSLIYARLSCVMNYEAILPTITVPQLHTLRIEFKKLRYTIEFFREVLGKPAHKVIGTLKEIQNHLGDLQDADVACKQLIHWLKLWDEQQNSLPLLKRQGPDGILGYLSFQYAQRQHLMETFPAAWDTFTNETSQQALVDVLAVLQQT